MEDFSSNEFPTIDDMWTSFKNILLNAMEESVPSKLSRSKPTHPLITTEVRRIINKKNKAGNKERKTCFMVIQLR
jgi:prephenate dehydrogenase